MTTEDDPALTRRLARLMGWEVYTEQDGEYDRWQRRLVAGEHERSCFIDLDGRAWVYDGVPLHTAGVYTTGSERQWRPLAAIGDAMGIVEHLGALGWEYVLGPCQDDGHYAQFSNYERRPGRPWPEWYNATASTLERTICEAALKTEVTDD